MFNILYDKSSSAFRSIFSFFLYSYELLGPYCARLLNTEQSSSSLKRNLWRHLRPFAEMKLLLLCEYQINQKNRRLPLSCKQYSCFELLCKPSIKYRLNAFLFNYIKKYYNISRLRNARFYYSTDIFLPYSLHSNLCLTACKNTQKSYLQRVPPFSQNLLWRNIL